MAKTWRKGEFGLESFDNIYVSFDSLSARFDDNMSGDYSDVNIPSDASFSDVNIPSDASFTDVSIPSDASYIDQSQPSDPTYGDIEIDG